VIKEQELATIKPTTKGKGEIPCNFTRGNRIAAEIAPAVLFCKNSVRIDAQLNPMIRSQKG